MVKLPEFLRRIVGSATPPAPARESSTPDWRTVTVPNPQTGIDTIFRAQFSKPARADLGALVTAVLIDWPYKPGTLVPPPEIVEAQSLFEAALEPFASGEDSELVHLSNGMGRKQWLYYARSERAFVRRLNDALAGHRRYPLQIQFFEDPKWRLWADRIGELEAHGATRGR